MALDTSVVAMEFARSVRRFSVICSEDFGNVDAIVALYIVVQTVRLFEPAKQSMF